MCVLWNVNITEAMALSIFIDTHKYTCTIQNNHVIHKHIFGWSTNYITTNTTLNNTFKLNNKQQLRFQ